MHPIRTAPKNGDLLLLNIACFGDNDWCVVGYYHRKHGWVLAKDLTRIHPVSWERYHAVAPAHVDLCRNPKPSAPDSSIKSQGPKKLSLVSDIFKRLDMHIWRIKIFQ